MNLKYHVLHGMKNLNYLMDPILYQIFKITLNISLKRHGEKINNPSIRRYVNKIENSITFRIKAGFHLELLMPETIKLFGSTMRKITSDKIGENVPHLEITELVLVHCHIVNNDYQQDSRILFAFVSNKSFGQLLYISPKNFIFLKTLNFEFLCVEVWFSDQNSKPLEIEDKINITQRQKKK